MPEHPNAVPRSARPPGGSSTPSQPVPSLAGEYARKGLTLHRRDGLTLTVCPSQQALTGFTDAAFYVRVTPPAGTARYGGNLYGHGPDDDDLDGRRFQDGRGGSWYRVRRAGHFPGGAVARYVVSPARRRRGRDGR